jgi:hypothetical protein
VRILLVTNDSQVFKAVNEGDHSGKARAVLGGRFTEVKNFADRLSTDHMVDLKIVSARYGLIDSLFLIETYSDTVEARGDIIDLDRKTGFIDDLMGSVEVHDSSIILLPKAFIGILLNRGLFDLKCRIIAVTSRDFENDLGNRDNCIFLERSGARLRKQNAKGILEILKEEDPEDDHGLPDE